MEAEDSASRTTTRFAYNAAGERVLNWRRGTDGTLIDARLFLRDEDGRVLSEYLLHDGEEAVLDHEYIYADARLAAQLDWSGDAPLVRYVAVDHLGSTRLVVDDSGTVVDTLEYYPYGALRRGSDVPPTTHLFTGHERDLEETGTLLDYMHARYCSYTLGRFMSVDPVGGEIGSSQSWNRYAYVQGNPVNAVDPDGEFSLWDIADIGFAAKSIGTLWRKALSGEQITTADNLNAIADSVALLPVVPSLGAVRESGKVLSKIDDAADAARAVEKVKEVEHGREIAETSHAARREAMRKAGTPTSRATTSQSGSPGNRQTVVDGPDGQPRIQTHHQPDAQHPNLHWHDAAPKIDPTSGRMRRNRHGQIKEKTVGRTTAEYSGGS